MICKYFTVWGKAFFSLCINYNNSYFCKLFSYLSHYRNEKEIFLH